ncbi:hypothetical protein M405DRAFT_31886 [Rhizopogon salebrosus TDB-379]|nr:hypothetical protein M405DRAFT_31886 [Rhizopogon salebrosus TDB-379]
MLASLFPDPISISGCVRNNTLIFNPQVPQNRSWNVIDQTVHDLKGFSGWGILTTPGHDQSVLLAYSLMYH